MWSLSIFAYIITVVYSQQQNTRRPEPHDNGHGWDIRLAVPGEPGGDYPTLNAIPRTSFSCSRKPPGYYADVETGCQVFKVCTLGSTYGFQSFLCPNGTLFNQEVFVCDWWMNVNCQKSQQLFNDNREKFGNLKLGPQLMKDIKKMLTHPMRNPYDKTIVKSNLVVMQEYKPPTGQLFPNGALIFGPERPPSNIYIPTKQRQGYFAQNSFISSDLSFAASTPSSQYIPSSFNGVISIDQMDNNIEVLQQQRQFVQPVQNFNSNTGAIHAKNAELINNNGLSQQSYHNQRNIQKFVPQNDQSRRQISQYNSNVNPVNVYKQPEQNIISKPTQQLLYGTKRNEQLIRENNVAQLPRAGNSPISREAQHNLASPNNPQPAGKTLKFSRIVQKSSSGTPKSRITFKTWIVRPSKSARLIVEPTPYSYNKPTNSPTDNRLVKGSSDNPNPTTEKVDFESEDVPYVYNKPTPSSNQVTAVERIPGIYLPPTEPTLSDQAYITTKFPDPKQSLLNLPPTTYKPASRFYVPPSQNSLELSRQYLSPHVQLPESINYQNSRLVAIPTLPALDFTTVTSKIKQTPSFTLTKQSHINTNHNNLSFADILTKEKLDITVNDIVKNTNAILKNASPDVLNQYREDPKMANNFANNFLSSEFDNDFDEKQTSQPSRALNKNEKLIATPSTELQPPEPEAIINNNQENSNKLLNLPFFREPVPTNTIERTVSLKISIPETIADYLFKNDSQSNTDSLEILKTGSSNYLVLTNSHLENNNDAAFIPIGKLVWDKNLNISNSQALVYSFLADSINTAKAYSNIAKQSLVSPASREPHTKNLNDEDIGDITNKISQLTSTHYANDKQKNANLVLSNASNGQYNNNAQQVTELSQKQLQKDLSYQSNYQNHRKNSPNEQYSSQIRLNSNNLLDTPDRISDPIYSGQLYKLPVPVVTSKIYNSPNPVQLPQIRQVNYFPRDSQQEVHANNVKKQSNADVELISTETSPYLPPSRQLLPLTEESTFNIQADSGHTLSNTILNSDAGITAQVQDKITGTLPHPLEENKLVTYQKNKSYYLYTKLDDENSDNVEVPNELTQPKELRNIKNSKLIRNNDLLNGVQYELFPAIGYQLEDDRSKQEILNLKTVKGNDFSDSKYGGHIESFNQRQGDLVTGVDFTILHPTSRKRAEQYNNVNSILYRGPSSYLAPQSSVGSLRGSQQPKNNARIEQFDNNNINKGYSKTIPSRQFTF